MLKIIEDNISLAEADIKDCRQALDKSYQNIHSYGTAYLKNSIILSELHVLRDGITGKTPEQLSAYLQTFAAGSARRLGTPQTGVFEQAIYLSRNEATARITQIIAEIGNECTRLQSTTNVPPEQNNEKSGMVRNSVLAAAPFASVGAEGGKG